MAKWIVRESEGKLVVLFRNSKTGQLFECGRCDPTTDPKMLVDWAAVEADAGDLILVQDRQVWLVLPEARA
jgi:hypothetical protein